MAVIRLQGFAFSAVKTYRGNGINPSVSGTCFPSPLFGPPFSEGRKARNKMKLTEQNKGTVGEKVQRERGDSNMRKQEYVTQVDIH